MKSKRCKQCGKMFMPRYRVTRAYWQRRRYCSVTCRCLAQPPPKRKGPVRPVRERFLEKIKEGGRDECWPWTGARDAFGYGLMFRTKKPRSWWRGHRLAYELFVGKIPNGLHVLHHCDNPPCCNPEHLWLGTPADNAGDKEQKGRGGQIGSPGADRRGEKNGNSHLNRRTVSLIRRSYSRGRMSQQAIADTYGVGQSQISRIVRRENWR